MNVREKGGSDDPDTTEIEVRVAKSSGGSAETVGKGLALHLASSPTGGLKIMPMDVLEAVPGGKDAAAALNSPEGKAAAEEAKDALATFGSALGASEAAPAFGLKVERVGQAAIICKSLPLPPSLGRQEACLALVDNVRLDFLLRNGDEDLTYEVRGIVEVNADGSLKLAQADSAKIDAARAEVVKSAGSLKDRYPDSFRADELPNAGKIAVNRYCAKLILGATCKYGDALKPCDAFRNAECMYGGLCGCSKGTCANSQGICVSENMPGAKQVMAGQNPCLQDDDDDEPLPEGTRYAEKTRKNCSCFEEHPR